ncbi:hypothetical protein VISP3789_09483 [Vibrio splendidus ATCC 33789]|jgi:hypothetical protein|nr:hypothetical protein VISP3789_09483 [Vibrio splendidus ATCC 33789]
MGFKGYDEFIDLLNSDIASLKAPINGAFFMV